jgi:hypothetical protein
LSTAPNVERLLRRLDDHAAKTNCLHLPPQLLPCAAPQLSGHSQERKYDTANIVSKNIGFVLLDCLLAALGARCTTLKRMTNVTLQLRYL